MPVDPSVTFSPPSPQDFESHLERYPARPLSWWVARAPLLVAAALFGISLVTADPLRALLPWVALAWLFGHTAVRARRAQALYLGIRRRAALSLSP